MGKDRLPPLRTLLFFEAAGRLLSFSAAARELACTQSAVSHQIGWLEADLGTALFRRLHRGVALTPDGVRLYEATRDALDGIGDAVTRIRDRRRPGVLNVATDFGFAAGWLLPRLSALRQLLPELDVRIVTMQTAIDLRREAADIAITFGHGHWPGCEAELLFPERVLPAAARLSGRAVLRMPPRAPVTRPTCRRCRSCIWKASGRPPGCPGATGSPCTGCRCRPAARS